MSQRKYILDLLAETGMLDCKPGKTPIVVCHGLQMIQGEELADMGRYQSGWQAHISLTHTSIHCLYCWCGKCIHASTTNTTYANFEVFERYK